MRKERNAIFQNNSASSYFYPMNQMGTPIGVPMATESNSNFYQGPIPNIMNNDYNSDLEARLAKIERQLNRFDTRISKLESEISVENNNDYNANNMYMV